MTLGQKKKFTGIVKRQRVAIGSKSEHDAYLLDQGNGAPLLEIRVKGANPFNNPALSPFVGKRVSIEGAALSGTAQLLVDTLADIKTFPSVPPKPRGPTP